MWSIDYVQVPIDEKDINITSKESKEGKWEKPNNTIIRPTPIHHRLVKQINVSSESGGSLIKSGSESSLSEDSNARRASIDRNRSGEGSTKEWRNEQEEEKETCSDTEESVTPVASSRRRRSRVQGNFRKSEGNFLLIISVICSFPRVFVITCNRVFVAQVVLVLKWLV